MNIYEENYSHGPALVESALDVEGVSDIDLDSSVIEKPGSIYEVEEVERVLLDVINRGCL